MITLYGGRPDPERSGLGAAVSISMVCTTMANISHGQETVKEGRGL